ncbi:MAG: RNA polymerase sigma factor [Acidimicrobiales bacterium]
MTTTVNHLPLSFDQFFADHFTRLVRFAALLCGDAQRAEELAQEAMMAVHQRWDVVDEPLAFAHRCVVNASHDLTRREMRWRRRVHLLAASPGVAPEHRELADALAALPVPQRTALVLRYYGGCTDAEVAAAMDVPLGTAKSHLQRGLEALRRTVER